MIVFILVVLVILGGLFLSGANKGTQRRGTAQRARPANLRERSAGPLFDKSRLPAGLGLLSGVPLQMTEARLQRAFDDAFGDSLRRRVMAQYPAMREDEFECRLLELKRYFLMTALLREVPMFSNAVDELWHEMLMFTREYQQFCEAFAGWTIHHVPNIEPVSAPGERAWFDWLYAHLFVQTPFSAALWNGFCRFPLDRERLGFIESADTRAIRERWFQASDGQADDEIEAAADRLIRQMKEEVAYAGERVRYQESRMGLNADTTLFGLSTGMLLYSFLDPIDFDRNMELAAGDDGQDTRKPQESNTGSACSSSACASGGSGSDSSCSTDSGGGSGSSCSSDSGTGSDGGGGGSSSCSSSSCSSGSSCGSSSCGSS